MKKIILIILLLLPFHMYAQDTIVNQEIVYVRAKQSIQTLNFYMFQMSNKNCTYDDRMQRKKVCLDFFVAGGEPFLVNGERNEGVQVQVTSIRTNGNKIQQIRLIKQYFNNLIHLIVNGRIPELRIVDCEVYLFNSNEMRKVSDTLYEFKCRHYKSIEDLKNNIYVTETLIMPICMCCDCTSPVIKFGNITVQEIIR